MVAARQDRMYSGETLTGCSDARQRQVRSSLTGGHSLTSIETGTALPGTSTKCDAREIHKRKILAGTRRGTEFARRCSAMVVQRAPLDLAQCVRRALAVGRTATVSRPVFGAESRDGSVPRPTLRVLGPVRKPPLPVFGQSGYFRGRFRPTRDQAPPLSNSRRPSGEAGMRKLGERPGCPSSTLYWLKSGGGLLV
jgi:hypothetical protein